MDINQTLNESKSIVIDDDDIDMNTVLDTIILEDHDNQKNVEGFKDIKGQTCPIVIENTIGDNDSDCDSCCDDDSKSLHIDLEINNNDQSMDLDWQVSNLDNINSDVIQSVINDDDNEDDNQNAENDNDEDEDAIEFMSIYSKHPDSDECMSENDDKYGIQDEIENDCYIFSSIIKQQIEMRVLMFKQNLKNYI